MELSLGQRNPNPAAENEEPRAAVLNENQVRAAAGLTLVIGAVAFSYAYFTKQYIPLQAAASLFLLEFLTRLTAGIRTARSASSRGR
jgi:hypothetical protein